MMSKNFHTFVDIASTPDRAWQVLTDFAAYPQWNPFIVEAQGAAHIGCRLRLRMQPLGAAARTLRPVVSGVVDQQRLQWIGRAAVPGILTAEHVFILELTRTGAVSCSRSPSAACSFPCFVVR
jgi:hypothetical protein